MRFWFTLLLSLWPLLLAPPPVRADPPAPAGLGLEPSPPPARVVWDKTPIQVTLTVGRERQLRFPRPVQVGLPAGLSGVLRSQSVDDTVYWQASAPLPVTRVLVKELDGGGRLYLLDVRAVAGAPPGPPASR